MGIPDCNVLMVDIHLLRLLWVYCPGHAGVKGNDRADRLAGKATLTSGLLLGRSEVLTSLRHYLWTQIQGYNTIDRLEETGVERGSTRRSSLKGRERVFASQTNIGTVSKATLGKLPREREREMGSSAYGLFRTHIYHLELNWTVRIMETQWRRVFLDWMLLASSLHTSWFDTGSALYFCLPLWLEDISGFDGKWKSPLFALSTLSLQSPPIHHHHQHHQHHY